MYFLQEEKRSSDEESEDEESEESSEEERERKKHKKSKKKKKKQKKKKKKHKRGNEHSEEREEKPSKKIKKEEDSFWGDSKPYESPKSKVSNGEGRREREKPREYDDERKPIDLGREARPYPSGQDRKSLRHSSR